MPSFNPPKVTTDNSNYKPLKTLPEHFEDFLNLAGDLRGKMTPVMKEVCALTDKMSLRGAATIQDVN